MKDNKSVVITGRGVICATGGNVEEFLVSLKEGKRGITEIALFDCSGYASQVAAPRTGQPGQEMAMAMTLIMCASALKSVNE